MKIKGDDTSVDLEAESAADIETLRTLCDRNPELHLASFATPDRAIQGVTIATRKLFDILNAPLPMPKWSVTWNIDRRDGICDCGSYSYEAISEVEARAEFRKLYPLAKITSVTRRH